MIVHSFLYVYQRIKFWDYVKLHSYRKHDQSRGICPDHLLDLTPAESWNALKAEEGLGSYLRNTLTGSVWWPGHSQCSVLLQFCCYIYPLKFPWYIYMISPWLLMFIMLQDQDALLYTSGAEFHHNSPPDWEDSPNPTCFFSGNWVP